MDDLFGLVVADSKILFTHVVCLLRHFWRTLDQLNHQPGGVLALAAFDRSRSIMWPTNTFAHEQTFFTMAVRQDRRGSAIQRTSEREAGVYATAERHLDVLGRCLHLRSLEIRR